MSNKMLKCSVSRNLIIMIFWYIIQEVGCRCVFFLSVRKNIVTATVICFCYKWNVAAIAVYFWFLIWFQVAQNVSVLAMTNIRYEVGVVTVLTRSKALRTELLF